MTTSHYLLLHLFIGLFFLSTPTLSRNILREDTPIAPSPSEDTSTTVLSPLVAPINPSTSEETTISPSPQSTTSSPSPHEHGHDHKKYHGHGHGHGHHHHGHRGHHHGQPAAPASSPKISNEAPESE
ncbi:hypothetical protein K7X08_015108 [Anisodus acutangulus]|uniref:Uncharacterized protein n=1 Tax=Anisodus acutangulus TaxID=402998 RepID=A0A9Q1QV80_9SOLA|nr:hypothetical protein K7X08_015108 [Anisodus acutangulus]